MMIRESMEARAAFVAMIDRIPDGTAKEIKLQIEDARYALELLIKEANTLREEVETCKIKYKNLEAEVTCHDLKAGIRHAIMKLNELVG